MTFRIFSLVIQFMMLSACANQGVIMTGSPENALEQQQVEVYLNQQPKCDFEVVAWMEFAGGFFDRSRLIDVFRDKAANLGADAIQIISLQKIGTTEYKGSARALRCIE